MCTNMPPPGAKGYADAPWDAYACSPATAIYVACETAGEFERYYAALSEKGEVVMPAGAYEFSSMFAWVTDRFGVSRRLNVAPTGRRRKAAAPFLTRGGTAAADGRRPGPPHRGPGRRPEVSGQELQSCGTCLVVPFSRLNRLVTAIMRTMAAMPFSS